MWTKKSLKKHRERKVYDWGGGGGGVVRWYRANVIDSRLQGGHKDRMVQARQKLADTRKYCS